MKKRILFLILLQSFITMAQAPQKMAYQSVVRNASNQIVANQNVGVKISIVEGSLTGSIVYSETHTTTTNANGLFTLEAGGGTPTTGTFSAINWGNGSHYIKSEIDLAGGTNYNLSGTTELLSVPYALYSEISGSTSRNINTFHGNYSSYNSGYWVVPNGINEINILFNGCQGGRGGNASGPYRVQTGGLRGNSAFFSITVKVMSGDLINFEIGSNGIDGYDTYGNWTGLTTYGGNGTNGSSSILTINGRIIFTLTGGTGGTGARGCGNGCELDGQNGTSGNLVLNDFNNSGILNYNNVNILNIPASQIVIRY